MKRKNNSAISRLRAERGWSVFTLAVKAKLHPNTVSLAERGVFTDRTISALARALGVEPSEITSPSSVFAQP